MGKLLMRKKKKQKNRGMGIVVDAGAEDLVVEDENYGGKASQSDFYKVKKALEDQRIAIESAEITLIPKSTVKVTGDDAKKILNLVNSLEEHEDVQNVYANFDIPDDLLKE